MSRKYIIPNDDYICDNKNTKINKVRKNTIENMEYFDTFIHFNLYCKNKNIDFHIDNILHNETQSEKEKRITELSSLINKNILDQEINIIFKSLSKIPYNEYIWIKNFINYIENISVCITLSTAKKENYGFPLLYVNKYFEKITGYNRYEVLGKNCKFLQPKNPINEEKIQFKILSNSLKIGIPVSTVVTNVKKNGTIFNNLVSVYPIIDDNGTYLYTIGIQTEITDDPINYSDIKNVIYLLNVLISNKLNIIPT